MVRSGTTFIVAALLLCGTVLPSRAQMRAGEVTGMISGGVNKYSGEFTDDIWGAGGAISLWYAPMNRLALEGRFGLGEIGWKVSQSDINRYPTYFGAGAQIGDLYPSTLTPIENENESRLTTIDLLVHYVIVDNIPAVPFISAGVGLVNFAPSTADQHEALPNYASEVYSGSAFSIPLGGGVRIPLSDRVGVVLRGEYRFVFSPYLDDLSANGSNDAVTSASLGFSYLFNTPKPRPRNRHHHHHHRHQLRPNEECPCCDGVGRHQHDCDCGMRGEQYESEYSEPTPTQKLDEPIDTSVKDGATPAPLGTTTDTTKAPPPAQPAPTEPTPAPKTTEPRTAELAPCASGAARVCLSESESVCVDTNITPGTDRIKWEDAFIYEPGKPTNLNTVKSVDATSPCYDAVIRQTASSYYMCTECCFEKIKLGGQFIYVILDEGKVSKGQGTFTPVNCPDCYAVAASGR